MRRARVLAHALLGGLVAGGLAVLPAAPAAADEVYHRPADGVFHVEGRGWGHGHGLNQWGAEGAARIGVTAKQILDHYYPGTAQATQAARRIRVLLQEDDHTDLRVRATSGMALRDRATNAVYPLPTGPSQWRIVQTSGGQRVQSYTTAWTYWSSGGKSTWAGPLQFESSAPIRLYLPDGSARDYRGLLRAVPAGSTTINVVNVLDLEQYLWGVVPRESPASFQPEALQAQSVAARSYSSYKMDHVPASAAWDICSTTMCQVYGGARLVTAGGTVIELEHPNTTGAVNATKGVVRTYGGAPIFAEFSSSNGGWSTQGSFAYLAPRADPWDEIASPHHYWTATLTADQLERRYPAVGRLLRIRVTRRDGNGDWGGRVKDVVLEGVSSTGAATSVTTTGGGVYSAHTWPASSTGLRGSWWHIKTAYSATLTAQSATPRLVQTPGVSTGKLAVHLKNTGGASWPVSGLHLAVASPAGSADALAGGTTRPGRFTKNLSEPDATEVAPGQVARFEIALDGDNVDVGTYRKSYRLRIGGGALFGPTVSWSVTVYQPVFTSAVVGVAGVAAADGEAPPPVSPDRTVIVPRSGATSLEVRVKNTGNVPWPVRGAVVLATADPRGRSSESAGATWQSPGIVGPVTGVAGVTGATSVKPGQVGIFPLTLHGNGRPVGLRLEAFEAKYTGYAFLAASKVTLQVVRVDPNVARLAERVSQPAPMSVLAYPGHRRSIVVRVRNLGGQSWPVGGSEVIATHDGRADALRTAAWLSASKATPLSRNVSRPGVAAVYPGEVAEYRIPIDPTNKAPDTYGEWFRAMTGAGALYGPTVGTSVKVSAAILRAEIVRNTAGVSVPRGGTAGYTIDLKNTGNMSWWVDHHLRISAAGSPSTNSSWLSPGRPSAVDANLTRPGATTVRPGEVARFTFRIAANGRAPGRYTETFGAGWEGWRSTGLRIPVSYVIV